LVDHDVGVEDLAALGRVPHGGEGQDPCLVEVGDEGDDVDVPPVGAEGGLAAVGEGVCGAKLKAKRLSAALDRCPRRKAPREHLLDGVELEVDRPTYVDRVL